MVNYIHDRNLLHKTSTSFTAVGSLSDTLYEEELKALTKN